MKPKILVATLAIVMSVNIKLSDAAPQQWTNHDSIAMQQQRINLKPMFDYLAAVMDTYGMQDFILEKLENDPSGQEIRDFFRGPDGIGINTAFWRDPEYTNFVYWMYDNGLTSLYSEINTMHNYFGWDLVRPPQNPQSRSIEESRQDTKSLKSLFNEFMEFYKDDLERGLNAYIRMLMSGDINALSLFHRMSNPSMARSWAALKVVPEVQKLFQTLRDEDIDIDSLILVIEQLLGWGR